MEGLEPPRLSAPEPKSGASTNFATSALKVGAPCNCPLRQSQAPIGIFPAKPQHQCVDMGRGLPYRAPFQTTNASIYRRGLANHQPDLNKE